MTNQSNRKLAIRIAMGAALALAIGGCASMQDPPSSRAGNAQVANPVPLVQNCTLVGVGSPTKYACNGKVYTSFKLAQMREQAAKQYASGK
jgi:hypothetical protein